MEYHLSDREILGQEMEWELTGSFLPVLQFFLEERDRDVPGERYVSWLSPLYRSLVSREALAEEEDNLEELIIGAELAKGILEENAGNSGNADLDVTDDSNKEASLTENEMETVQDAADVSGIFASLSDFVPVSEKQREYDWNGYTDITEVRKEFFAVDATTEIADERLDPAVLLTKDISITENNGGPQILIYHTHSQETFADSLVQDASTSIVGAGEYLSSVLKQRYGYEVLHHTGEYDVESRDYAYSNALPAMESVLAEYPSIEVVIDLHRDAVAEDTKLVSVQNGKTAAQVMFFNGLSHTKKQGDIDYLENPYIDDNLAFAFQMQVLCNEYYPGITRRIYLKGYRYNMHLCSKSLLIELGAQTNTCEEVKNSLDIIADVLDKCLKTSR